MIFELNTNPAQQGAPIRLLQLTDSHLLEQPDARFAGLLPLASLEQVVAHAATQPAFHCVISTGDLAQQPTHSTYQTYLNTVAKLDIPHFWIKGNHDSGPDFPLISACDEPIVIVSKQWCLILMNSQKDDCICGWLSERTLKRLTEILAQYQQHFILLALHHNTFDVGSRWLDQHRLQNADAFLAILGTHQHVKIVLSGHVHQEIMQQYASTSFMACPSTCIQFKPYSDEFAFDQLPPGYRTLELHSDGSFYTQVWHIEKLAGQIDDTLTHY